MALKQMLITAFILVLGFSFQNCSQRELTVDEGNNGSVTPPTVVPNPNPTTPDSPLSSPAASYVVNEGEAINITISIAAARTTDLAINWNLRPEAANASYNAVDDFTNVSGSLSIPAGQTSVTFAASSKDNLLSSVDKDYLAEFGVVGSKVFSLKLIIRDNDQPRLSGTGLHNCLLKDGGVRCFGFNAYGELGDGSTTNRFAPADVVSMGSGVTQLSAGQHTSCAVKNSAAFCWGYNYYGQIGNGIVTGSGAATTAPQAVLNMQEGVSKVSTGAATSCGIKNGALYCWGYNGNGQFGNGTTSPSTSGTAAAVPTMNSGVTDVDISIYNAYHVCAVKNGGAYCWGYNGSGQLGDGTTIARYSPTPVVGLGSGVTSIGLGNNFACAIKDGSIYCWGANSVGELGLGDATNRTAAVKLPFFNGKTIKKLSVGGAHSCAIVVNSGNNEVYCWGQNVNGNLGTGNTLNASTPQRILALDGATDVNASALYDGNSWAAMSLAIVGNRVMATGNNSYGQYGNNAANMLIFQLGFMF